MMLITQGVLLLLFVHIQTSRSLDAGLSAYEISSFPVPFDCDLCDPKFYHFVIHDETGDIYLGSSNHLVRLTSSYQQISNINTFLECDEGIDREDCINHNKLLVIYYDRNILITCGSSNQDVCQIRDANDITSTISIAGDTSESVVAPGEQPTEYIIAPGIVEKDVRDLLYVAATAPNKRDVPALSRRSLENDRTFLSNTPDSTLNLFSTTPPDFFVNYKDVFVHNKFTYFATNQPFDFPYETENFRKIISKLNRLCQDSDNLNSYTEVVIECRGNDGGVYNLIRAVHIDTLGSDLANALAIQPTERVLIGLFAKSVEPTEYNPGNQSAVCIFKMDDIENRFLQAIAACFESMHNREGVDYLQGKNCAITLDQGMDTAKNQKCNAFNYAHARGLANAAIEGTAVMELSSTLGSSIIITTEEQHTVAFIGTTSGQLAKLHLTGNSSRVYETLTLGSPVLKDTHLDKAEGRQNLTVLTENKVFKFQVENCGYYKTCEECIGVTEEDGDPYCGWCSLTRTCTRKRDCDMPDVSTRWLSYNIAQCSGISSVTPYDSQPYTVQQNITVTVEQLPDLGADQGYECVFEYGDTHSLSSMAAKNGNELVCMTPSIDALPQISPGSDHVTMLLSITSSETSVKFVDTNHTFFECATHTRCLDCASSSWDCDWCVYGDVCTHNTTQCSDDTDVSLIAGEKHHRANPSRRGPAECAQLEEHVEEVLLPSGVERNITINVKNLPDLNEVFYNSYLCILYIEDEGREFVAERVMDTVYCTMSSMYSYDAEIQELTANLTLHWNWGGTRRTIDDEFGFQVTLFKCDVDRPDCSRCVSALTTRPELGCGWCDSQMCAVEDHPQCIGLGSWIREDGSENCPNPVIHSISPESGPIEGNTRIVINGTDIGRGFSSIKNITVAGRECQYADLEDEYEMSQRLSCVTSTSEIGQTGDVLITVMGIDGTDQMNSDGTSFAYNDPQIDAFSPNFGPESGGTMVKINGSALLTGRDMTIEVGNASCLLERGISTETELTCFSGESYEGNRAQIRMTFDGTERYSANEYEYTANPIVDMVHPNEAFESGGRILRVTGSKYDVVQSPQVRVVLNNKEYTEKCKVVNENATLMECPSPPVTLPTRKRRQEDDVGVRATLGFLMDGVTALRVWSDINNFTFEYFEDPIYYMFEGIVDRGDELLEIKGERLNLASDESDVQVYLGGLVCEVVNLGSEGLSCALPAELVNNTDAANFTVNATIHQGNLIFENIGTVLIVTEPTPPRPGLPLAIIIGVAAVAFVLLVLIIIITATYQYREKHAREQTLRLLNEMEKLEDSMSGRIRDAFAQLQLDLQDLTSDLEGTGMPFVTLEQYATNMLFAGINSKPSTKDPIDLDERKERAMTEFCKLLEDKHFLLAFIQVLDEPRSAPQPVIRERTKFACFLTTLMIVEDKLPYLTDIMLTLLKRYIEEAVDEEKEFQLCQRTETVGERLLTNWVSVCLFKYLKDQAAFPLFVLFRAILLQTEKGPVDIVNGKAYYSLSEHYVLTLDNLEFKDMTLNVVVNEDGETKPLGVTNLDTISQVKEKVLDLIYRNKAYSQRPDVSVVDLEWRQGQAGRLILRDNDNTTETDEEFRKLNTLDHYKVLNNATVALVLKQNVPNGTIDPTVLRRSIFVNEDDDDDEEEEKVPQVRFRNPRVSLYQKRARARFTVYELGNLATDDPDRDLQVYHLVKEEEDTFEIGNRKSWAAAQKRLSRRISNAIKQRQTNIKRIHYPQLLTTKGATQQYVESMFKAVLDKDHIPKTVKYVFDFLEAEARSHNIVDADILHKWKSNCLPLRFWVTVLNNPQHIFDIRESRSVTSSMHVVGQAFFDAFNRTDYQHTKVTGFNKLLYHRELGGFQDQVDKYYMAVNDLPEVDTTEIAEELDMISQQFTGVFSRMSTLMQLYHFAQMNNDKLLEALEEDEICSRARLAYRLENVASILEGETV